MLASPDPARLLALLALLLLAPPILALESDRRQPINIVADRITIDDKKGFSHYSGNVIMTQGSLRVTGDDIKVFLDPQRKLRRLVVTGKPATMQQKTEGSDELVKSRALYMEYVIATDMLHLQNQAHIEQGPNRFSGNRIDYNMKTSLIEAQKASDGSERVNITIMPEQDRQDTGPNPGDSPP